MLDPLSISRRSFVTHGAYGLGGIAMAMLGGSARHSLGAAPGLAKPDDWCGALDRPHLPVKAKRVIFLCMAGGPSQFESFDWKPALKALDGQPFPDSFTQGQQLAQLQNTTLKA